MRRPAQELAHGVLPWTLAEVLSAIGDRGVDAVGLGDHLIAAGVEVQQVR